MGTNHLLNIDNLRADYGNVTALDGISLHVDKGEIVALIGQNGAGKSTTLKAIFGLVKPVSGKILFDNEDITHSKPEKVMRKGISYVLQGRRIFTQMTVDENLELGAYILKDKKVIETAKNRIFKLFPILEERRKLPAGKLSGGEQQMLAVGTSLMLSPKLVLFDEPSLGLAPRMVTLVFDIIKSINDLGTAILIVEQNVKRVLQISDRTYVLGIGRIVST